MSQRRKSARVLGPYQHGNRWRLIVVNERGKKTPVSYESEAEALEVRAKTLAEAGPGEPGTTEELIQKYEVYLRETKQNRESSIATTLMRLRRFFAPMLARDLRTIAVARCQARYDELRAEVKVTTHHGLLSESRTFVKWAVKKKWISRSPLAGIDPVGRKRKRKAQLRVDEARRFEAKALELADAGNDAGLAVLLALKMGLRASEIVSRTARDVDDGGRLVWIEDTKTEAGRRTLEVPEDLVERLAARAKGKLPTAPLFRSQSREWLSDWVVRICALAAVPRVTAHGLRGTWATDYVRTTGDVRGAAAALGHKGTGVTRASYVQPGAEADARTERALKVLQGGVK